MLIFGIIGFLLLFGGVANAIREHGNGRENYVTAYAALALFGLGIAAVPALTKGKSGTAAAAAIEAPADPRGTREQQEYYIVNGQIAVKERLKDPGSAVFKNQFFSFSGGVKMTCGWVNSKNGFGGYVGFQRYFSNTLPEYTLLEQEYSNFDEAWRKLCQG